MRGNVSKLRVYGCEFEPCNQDTFPALKAILEQRFHPHRFMDPFINSEAQGLENGKYKGYLREWIVLDFDTQVATQPGWGVTAENQRLTICYQDGVLGIAIRFDSGITKEKNTLTTFKSMYKR